MSNTIRHKRGTSDPSASDFSETAELLVNTADGGLFTKTDGGSVVEIGAGGGGASDINGLSDAKTANSGAALGLGTGALAADDGGNNTIAIGKDALNDQTSGNFNCAIGVEALSLMTTGNQNMAFGVYAGRRTTGSSNVFVGYSAGEGVSGSATGGNNLALGEKCMENYTSTSNNVAIGTRALRNATSGGDNVTIGYYSGSAITTGNRNVSSGHEALYATTTGSKNVAVGWKTLSSLTTGSENTTLGYKALSTANNSNETAIGSSCFSERGDHTKAVGLGYGAGKWNEGDNNTAIGYESCGASGVSAGNNNTGVGYQALYAVTTGNDNTTLGYQAGNSITTGSNNTVIGNGADSSSATVSNEITLGNSSIATLRCNTQTISSLSDGRDKTEVTELPEGLDFINSLNPVKFQWQTRDGNGKDGTYEAGFIAQHLQHVQRQSNAEYLGLVMDENPERLEASYGKLVPMLVKAIQELKSEVEQLKANV
jgi:hypothetical protein